MNGTAISLRNSLLACAFGAALATTFSPVPAQAGDSVSQSATSDGRKFADLSEADVDALPRPERKRYYAWKNSELDAEAAEREKRIAEMNAKAIVQWFEYVDVFTQLHAIRSNAGFDHQLYAKMKHKLASVLDSGEPPAVVLRINQTPGLRAILQEGKR